MRYEFRKKICVDICIIRFDCPMEKVRIHDISELGRHTSLYDTVTLREENLFN